MSGYSVVQTSEVDDVLGDYPGEMRFMTEKLGCEQVAVTYRTMPKGTGGKGSYGHRHKTQEEVYFVVGGTLQFKVEDDVFDVPAGSAVRVAPQAARSIWNERDEDGVLVIVSTNEVSASEDAEKVEGFWPE